MNNEPELIIDADDDEQFGFAVEAVEVGPRGKQGIQGEPGVQGVQGDPGFSPIVNFQRSGNNLEAQVTDQSGTRTTSIPYPSLMKLAEAVGTGTSSEMSVTFPNNGQDFTVIKLYLQPRVTANVNEIYLRVNNKTTNNYAYRITDVSDNSTNSSSVSRSQNKIPLALLNGWWISGELMEITVSLRKEGGTSCKIHSDAQNTVGDHIGFDAKQTIVTGIYADNSDTSPTTTITIGVGPSTTAKWHEKAKLTAYAILN